jgi:hypothetical protein
MDDSILRASDIEIATDPASWNSIVGKRDGTVTIDRCRIGAFELAR